MSSESFSRRAWDQYRYIAILYPWVRTCLFAVLNILCPLTWPFWCYWVYRRIRCSLRIPRRRTMREHYAKLRKEQMEREELSDIRHKRRIRALENRKRSPSVDRRWRRPMNPQDGSRLLSSLPAEIRLHIYEMALGGRVHVRPRDRHHELADGHAMRSTTCVRPTHLGVHELDCFNREISKGRLNLILTCRKA